MELDQLRNHRLRSKVPLCTGKLSLLQIGATNFKSFPMRVSSDIVLKHRLHKRFGADFPNLISSELSGKVSHLILGLDLSSLKIFFGSGWFFGKIVGEQILMVVLEL